MCHLGMELQTKDGQMPVAHGSDSTGAGLRERKKITVDFGDLISMAHPHVQVRAEFPRTAPPLRSTRNDCARIPARVRSRRDHRAPGRPVACHNRCPGSAVPAQIAAHHNAARRPRTRWTAHPTRSIREDRGGGSARPRCHVARSRSRRFAPGLRRAISCAYCEPKSSTRIRSSDTRAGRSAEEIERAGIVLRARLPSRKRGQGSTRLSAPHPQQPQLRHGRFNRSANKKTRGARADLARGL